MDQERQFCDGRMVRSHPAPALPQTYKPEKQMTKRKCKCPPDSPFHWRDNPRPSMFATDPHLKAAATLSHNQTMVVEREREKGRDISNVAGLSAKQTARIISIREFNIFSRAGQDL
jgi:hypothetical protein